MSALLRLYPAAWRDRYGEELGALLAENPPSIADSVDLVRGALDAHLHKALVPATAGPGGSGGASLDAPAVPRRVPVGAFLGTLAAGLFIMTAGSLAISRSIPHIATELPSTLLALASFVLGLTLWATTGRAVIAKLAGLVFLGGIAFVAWTGVAMPAIIAIGAGSALLVIGGVVERRPSLTIAALTAGLGIAAWTAYRAESELLGVVFLGYAVVSVSLARAQGGSLRPIALGLAGTAAAVAIAWTWATATSPRILHDGYSLRCIELDQAACTAEIDTFVDQIRSVGGAGAVEWALATATDGMVVCLEPPAMVTEATMRTQEQALLRLRPADARSITAGVDSGGACYTT